MIKSQTEMMEYGMNIDVEKNNAIVDRDDVILIKEIFDQENLALFS